MLNPMTKADRTQMADLIRSTAAENGATCTVREEGNTIITKRNFHATVHCGHGLNASLTVDATGQNARDDVYVVAWHMDSDCDEKLSTEFECAIGHVNVYHRRKATSVVRGFDLVLSKLQVGITMATDRSAFMQLAETAP